MVVITGYHAKPDQVNKAETIARGLKSYLWQPVIASPVMDNRTWVPLAMVSVLLNPPTLGNVYKSPSVIEHSAMP